MTITMLNSAAAQDGREHDRQRQERDHQEPLGDPERDPSDPAAEVTRAPARGRCRAPSRSRWRQGPRSSEMREPQISSVSDRAAVLVGPEPVARRRRTEHGPLALVTSRPSELPAAALQVRRLRRTPGCLARACRCGVGGTVSRSVSTRSARRRRASCRAERWTVTVWVMCAPAGRSSRRSGWRSGWR